MGKLTPAEMRLFALGAALYGSNTEGALIVSQALHEMQQLRRKAESRPRRAAKSRPRRKGE